MDEDIDDYLREMRELQERELGLPPSSHTLLLRIRSSEREQTRIRNQCHDLRSKLKKKDNKTIERIMAESRLKAHASNKFEQEHDRFTNECADLLTRNRNLENECSLKASDLEAFRNFRDQADERAKEAESRVHDLEDEISKLSEELQLFKHQSELECTENSLVNALISTLINKDEVASTSNSFLEANSGNVACQKLLKIWNGLNPSTHNILALVSEVKNLQNDIDILRSNLIKAEEEVTVLFNENNTVDTENTILTEFLDSRGTHSS